MSELPALRSSAPTEKRRRFAVFDLAPSSDVAVRQRSFWAGWGGRIITFLMGALVVALLVGWVLLWVRHPGGANLSLLVLGCVAFTLVLAVLATLQVRLTTHWRLRQAEAVFLTGISHSLRTPIGAIRAAAQASQRTGLSEEQRARLLEAIIHETRRLALRIDNVLETGRIDVERQAFAGEPVHLSALVEKVVSEVEGGLQVHGGQLDANLESDIWVFGDVRALHLLLGNLFDNAVKYSDGPPILRLLLKVDGQHAVLQLQDQGIGFVSGRSGTLFRRFVRGDTGRAGTGLGLPLSRAVARGHGGEVHLFSDGLGQGATAELWLPIHTASEGG